MPNAALTLEIKVDEVDVKALLKAIPKEIEQKQRSTMSRALMTLKIEAQRRIWSPEGRARRGIAYEVRGGATETLSGILRSRSKAAIFSQRSTGPDRKAPPVRRIAAWLRRRGQLRSRASAFLVARAIARKGTKGRPVMEDTLRVKRAQIVGFIDQMVRRALRR